MHLAASTGSDHNKTTIIPSHIIALPIENTFVLEVRDPRDHDRALKIELEVSEISSDRHSIVIFSHFKTVSLVPQAKHHFKVFCLPKVGNCYFFFFFYPNTFDLLSLYSQTIAIFTISACYQTQGETNNIPLCISVQTNSFIFAPP